MKKALFLCPYTPSLSGGGIYMRAYWTLKALEREYEVEVITIWPQPVLPLWLPGLLYRLSPDLYYFLYRKPSALREVPTSGRAWREVDLVHVYRLEMLPLLEPFVDSGIPIQVDVDDLEEEKFLEFARLHAVSNPSKARLCQQDARYFAQIERRVCDIATRLFATSARDRATLASRTGLPVVHVPNVYPRVDRVPALPDGHDLRILFVGGLDYFPNEHGLLVFLQQVWPRLAGQGFHLTVCGCGGDRGPLKRALTQAGIDYVGFAPDLWDHYARCHVAIAPIYAGGGTRIKILEAFSHGRTVVSTVKGAEGLEVTAGQELWLIEEMGDFEVALRTLKADRALLQQMSSQALEYVEHEHRPEHMDKLLPREPLPPTRLTRRSAPTKPRKPFPPRPVWLRKLWRSGRRALLDVLQRRWLLSLLSWFIRGVFPERPFQFFLKPDGRLAGLLDPTSGRWLTLRSVNGWSYEVTLPCGASRRHGSPVAALRALQGAVDHSLGGPPVPRRRVIVVARKSQVEAACRELGAVALVPHKIDDTPYCFELDGQVFETQEHVLWLLEPGFGGDGAAVVCLQDFDWAAFVMILLSRCRFTLATPTGDGEALDKVARFLSGEGIAFESVDLHSAPTSASQPRRRSVDTLGDLHLVRGEPLETDYVFVVAFRNQAAKIARCLRSILNLPREGRSFGFVVIDDASSDGSLHACLKVLEGVGLPHTVVSNPDRRYYTRNLYNAVHLLTVRPEAVVIEVDGDDYLPAKDILGILDRHYRRGALKTFGSFSSESPVNVFGHVGSPDPRFPWDLDRCTSWMHLKSFRKLLFEQVPLDYFFEQDSDHWLKMGEDLVVHPKMMELAGERAIFLSEVLYCYDFSGPDHDNKSPEHAAYILHKLYRIPVGSWMRELPRLARQRKG